MGAAPQQRLGTRAFRALYLEHYGFVWSTARRMGVRSDAVDDVVQDAFLTAFRRWSSLPSERARAWLYGITRRVSSNYRRQERRRTRKHDALALARPAVVEVEGQLSASRALDRFLASLDERDRELFVLGAIEGLTGAELATALQARPSTLYSRLATLRARFRDDVGPAGPSCLRARASSRPRATAARWALLQPLLAPPGASAAAGGGLGAGAGVGLGGVWGAVGVAGAALAVVAATASAQPEAATDTSRPRRAATDEARRGGEARPIAAATDEGTLRAPAVTPNAAAASVPRVAADGSRASHGAASKPRWAAGSQAPSRKPPASRPGAPSTAAASSDLRAEAVLVRQATEALARADAAAALRITDTYRARFPDGALRDAAEAVGIEALCMGGDVSAARARARVFLRDAPGSPVAARIRRACAREEKTIAPRNRASSRTQP